MRPDLLILDAGDAVTAAAAIRMHRPSDYEAGDRTRAAGLVRLAENRLRQVRRRLEAGLHDPTGSLADVPVHAVADRLAEEGWIDPSDVAAVAATMTDEILRFEELAR